MPEQVKEKIKQALLSPFEKGAGDVLQTKRY
jgi:hypothetical protein